MNKRMPIVIIVGAVIAAFLYLTPSAARATTTQFIQKGTAADLSVTASLVKSPGCTIDLWISLTASTSIQRSDGSTTSGAGAFGFVQRYDNCAGTSEFGNFDVPLATGFTASAKSVSLTVTIPMTLTQFGGPNDGSTVDRSLVLSSLQFTATGTDTVVSRHRTRYSYPTASGSSNGRSVYRPATVTGSVTFDGKALLSDPSVAFDGSITTSVDLAVSMTH